MSDYSWLTFLSVVGFFILCLLMLCLWALCFRWVVISYELTPKRLNIKLFHLIPIYRIDLEDIDEIQEEKWKVPVFLRGGFITRPFSKSYVMIKLKGRRLFREASISPKDPEKFIARVKSVMNVSDEI